MPGVIHNLIDNDIVSDPNRFNPRDTAVWEWIWGDESPDEDTFSLDSATAFNSGYLHDVNLLFDALCYFLGFSELIPNGDERLVKVNRHNPAVHPRWPMLRCSQVSVKGVKYDGTVSTLATYTGGVPKLPVTEYEKYRFDITWAFPQFDYRENADSGVTSEWDRCLTVTDVDETEVIVVDGAQYDFIAPTHAALNGVPVAINGPSLKVYAQRTGLIVTAYQLPANYIYNTFGIPVHFLAAKGKVNSDTVLGLPADTLLLQGYKITKKAQPLATKNVGLLSYAVDVEMHFGYTDPTRAEASETRRGWQLVPANYGTGAGWFGVKNSATNENLYPSYPMLKLLQHWST